MTRHNPIVIGDTFSRLTIVRKAPSRGKRTYWWVRCQCGAIEREVSADHLKSGHTTSCGCHARQRASGVNTKHGCSDDPTYNVWLGMWGRCTNKNNKSFQDYSGRTPPIEWKDYSVFLRELGPRPSAKHTLERIKNNEPYGPGNCCWATREEQNRNKSDTVWVTFQGQTKRLSDWATELGLSMAMLYNRRSKGLVVPELLAPPKRRGRPPLC